ncbi:MAG: PIN domain-containing protein [Pyrinomonadaceae bacterium]
MAFLVFDACALIALAYDEEGADYVESYLADDENNCFIHSLTFCEFYYQVHRRSSKDDAAKLVDEIIEMGVNVRDDMDVEFWQTAGDLKAIHKRISLADCCALTLANRLDAELVTSDHHELDPLAAQGVCKISFFR